MPIRSAVTCLMLLGGLSGIALAQAPKVLPWKEAESAEDTPEPKKAPELPSLPAFRLVEASPLVGPPPSACQMPDTNDDPDDILRCFGVRAEYLLWGMKKAPLTIPILIDRTTNQTVVGNQDVRFNLSSGVRVGGLIRLDSQQIFTVEVNGFAFQRQSVLLGARSDGNGLPRLDRPFFIADTNDPLVFPISLPNQLTGGLQTSLSTQLAGTDANLSVRLFDDSSFRFEVLGGFRYASLRERVNVLQESQVIVTDPSVVVTAGSLGTLSPGSSITISDNLRVSNNFYGGQLGLRSGWRFNSFFATFTGTAALGENDEFVHTSGSTSVLPGPASAVGNPAMTFVRVGGESGLHLNQGLFSGPGNIGVFSHTQGSFIGEANLTFGFDLTPRLHLFAGYSFFYWSRVLRASNQLDQTISPSSPLVNQPATAGSPSVNDRPTVLFKQSDFWGQGLNIGLAFEF